MFNTSIVIALVVSTLSVLYSLILYRVITKKPEGNKKTIDITKEIQTGAKKFLSRKFSAVSIVTTVVFVVLLYGLGWQIAIGFLAGSIASALIGYFAVILSSSANTRTVEASKKDFKSESNIFFKSGHAIGFFTLGIGLLIVAGFYAIFSDVTVLLGLVLGTSVTALFSRNEKIFFKEENKSENIGRSNNIISDIFETYLLALVAAMFLAKPMLTDVPNAILFPIVLVAVFVISIIISTFFVRIYNNSKNIIGAIHRGAAIALALTAVVFYFISHWMIKSNVIQNFSRYYGLSILLLFILSVLGAIISLVVLEQSAKDTTNIAQTVGLSGDIQVNIDPLESTSEVAGKITKHFSIIIAFLLSVVAFAAFGQRILQVKETVSFDLRDYHILVGLLLGGVFSYYFFQTLREGVDKTISVNKIVIESLVAILLPVFIGFILGIPTLGGFLIGAIFIGFFPALFMSTSTINSVVKTVSIVALLIAPAIINVNISIKNKAIITAILIVLIIIIALIFSSKQKSKFLKWLHK